MTEKLTGHNTGLAPCLYSIFEKTIFMKENNLTSEQQFI